MKKLKIFVCLLIILCSAFFVPSITVFADENKNLDKIYVALGDSIAEGYAIDLTTRDDGQFTKKAENAYNFINESYTQRVYNYLTSSYKYNKGYNFSHEGYTCKDLNDLLKSFCNGASYKCKDPTSTNAKYNTFTNQEIYDIFTNAKTFTISIGANNILGKMIDLLPNYFKGSLPYENLETIVKVQVSNFRAEFQELLDLIYGLNENSEVYFTTIYNPYVYEIMELNNEVVTTLSMAGITQEKLYKISALTEIALNANEVEFKGLNRILKDEIDRTQTINDKKIFYLVNSYKKFNDKLNLSADYENYVNTRVDKLTMSDLAGVTDADSLEKVISRVIDPHPTAQGHSLIFEGHKDQKIGTNYYEPANINKKIVVIIGISLFVLAVVVASIVAYVKSKNRIC